MKERAEERAADIEDAYDEERDEEKRSDTHPYAGMLGEEAFAQLLINAGSHWEFSDDESDGDIVVGKGTVKKHVDVKTRDHKDEDPWADLLVRDWDGNEASADVYVQVVLDPVHSMAFVTGWATLEQVKAEDEWDKAVSHESVKIDHGDLRPINDLMALL